MGDVLIVRWGAFGDHVHMSNVIRAFDEDGWNVSVEYNSKGAHIHKANPRIKRHLIFETGTADVVAKVRENPMFLNDHIEAVGRNYDRTVSLQGSLEDALIEPSRSHQYQWPLWKRRLKNANICYYDQSMIWAGLTDKKYMGRTGEIYFTNEEHQMVGEWVERRKEKYVVLWCLRGSMYQKAVYPMAQEVIGKFCEKHPEALVITTGDDFCKQLEWDHPQVMHKSGAWPFRQTALLARYVDMVVTPETGLGIVAGVFGTPKIMLLTAASLKNVVGNDENDFSLQSPAWCSPCTRAIYDTDHCEHWGDRKDFFSTHSEEGHPLPICVNFNPEEVLARMEEVYAMRIRRKQYDPTDRRPVYM